MLKAPFIRSLALRINFVEHLKHFVVNLKVCLLKLVLFPVFICCNLLAVKGTSQGFREQ